ncbi:MAG TPA: hypothetical protein PLX06_02225 [Fimbriimonadaceae bacterium]|nr:hypothetical protein [Fimbriimonadaceae bacterium]
MRKWGLLFAAAAAVMVGCDGGSGSSGVGGGGGGGGVTLSSINPAIFSNSSGAFGRVEVTYNTGQGRAPGSLTAVVDRLSLVDELFPIGDSRNNVDTFLNPSRNLGLDAYTSQSVMVNVPMSNLGFSGPVNGRFFDSFTLSFARFLEEQFNGSLQTVTDNLGNVETLDEVFGANILALAGRTNSLQVFIDDAMITADSNGITFDRDLFEAVNLVDDGSGNMILLGHIADYVVFDISSVASKPTMSNSVPATRFWVSGDNFALSGDVGAGSEYMEVLTPLPPPIEGVFNPPVPLPGGIGPGTYTLLQNDPVDISGLAKIAALRGTWRNYSDANTSQSAFLNLGTFECFTFPQSLDQDKHDMVVVSRTAGGTITNLYFGQMDFDSNSFSIWPIAQVDDGDASNEVSGTISGLLDRNGGTPSTNRHVRSGTFTITGGGVPAGFASSGRFIVYRL